jgi:uridine phosphorylase
LIEKINYKKLAITNLEMETSALYFLGRSLGHNTITICAVLANRLKQEYSKEPKKLIDHLIQEVLNKL